MPEAEVDSMVWRAKQKISPGLLITHGLEVWQRKGLIPTDNLSSDDCMYELSRQVKKFRLMVVRSVVNCLAEEPDLDWEMVL